MRWITRCRSSAQAGSSGTLLRRLSLATSFVLRVWILVLEEYAAKLADYPNPHMLNILVSLKRYNNLSKYHSFS